MGIQYSFRRYEKKYFLSPRQQEQLLRRIAPYIKEDAFDSYTICNIYYDTPDWRLIRASLEKPAYKEKLRVRSYGVPTETDRVFVELKKKFDGVVYKRRITTEVPQVEPLLCGSTEAKCQIGSSGSSGRTAPGPVCSSAMTGWPLPGRRIRSCG